MLRGIKAATLDVDIVLENEKDREYLIETMKKLGYRDLDYRLAYIEKKDGTPKMLQGEKVRFDFFLHKVITSDFSEKMKKRADETHEFENLILKAAHPTDIAIMKSATDREKDDHDIILICDKKMLDWNIMLYEIEEQFRLGNERAIFDLGYKLEKLTNIKAIIVPKEILDRIVEFHNNNVEEREKKR
ncbi:hypothetical protein J4461_00310 [Candidatus Pacearchaeota archaeon]|nr:hypothetical protein [Candidatus Pacearchaeota archaeon]